jgi:hypothetical protein
MSLLSGMGKLLYDLSETVRCVRPLKPTANFDHAIHYKQKLWPEMSMQNFVTLPIDWVIDLKADVFPTKTLSPQIGMACKDYLLNLLERILDKLGSCPITSKAFSCHGTGHLTNSISIGSLNHPVLFHWLVALIIQCSSSGGWL